MKTFDRCIICKLNWVWDSKDVQDFNKPVGKRIWPALCVGCRENIETKYKSGRITKAELLLEFSTISGKISKLLADTGSLDMSLLKMFKPQKRGK